jgi:hypothetical protein
MHTSHNSYAYVERHHQKFTKNPKADSIANALGIPLFRLLMSTFV